MASQIERRKFLATLGSAAAAWPVAARAQQPTMPVIGFLSIAPPIRASRSCVQRGLKEIGYLAGQNVAIEYRWAEGQYERLPALSADLVRRQVTVIAATGGSVEDLRQRRRPRRYRLSSVAAVTLSSWASSPA